MKYKVILFDADETLFDFRRSEQVAFENTMKAYNFDYEEAYHLPIYQEINNAIWKEFENGLITQKVLKIERFRRLMDKLGAKHDPEAFANAYIKHLGQASYPYNDSIPLLESLHKDYRIGIVTNGLAGVQNHRIKQSILAPYLDTVVISEEVEISKPDPRIFEIALHNLGHEDKSTVLMVGDSLSSDIQGGINFGIDTCWYNPFHLENMSSITPTYVISELLSLKGVLY